MTQVVDHVDVTSLDPPSPRRIGGSVSSQIPLAGGNWVATLRGATAEEAAKPRAAVNEFDYRVSARPISWTLERTEIGFVAANQVTGIFGSGQDPNEAFRDLFAALHEHRDVLERQESLSPGLQEQLEYLRALL